MNMKFTWRWFYIVHQTVRPHACTHAYAHTHTHTHTHKHTHSHTHTHSQTRTVPLSRWFWLTLFWGCFIMNSFSFGTRFNFRDTFYEGGSVTLKLMLSGQNDMYRLRRVSRMFPKSFQFSKYYTMRLFVSDVRCTHTFHSLRMSKTLAVALGYMIIIEDSTS